ncbi:MAG: TetR/AcrR family transcriptional regulator [Verrucomicrobiae bacterium]|nr:TetR/AcrR family transcriptional regulator [Verrucomicrobiae bacterium]
MPLTRNSVIDSAELIIRKKGYNGFSLEEVAKDLQVDLPEISQFFTERDQLARAVAVRYTYNFLVALGDPSPKESNPEAQLKRYCGVFEKAYQDSGLACLCAVLSKEAATLPEDTKSAVVDFVTANIAWLTKALRGTDSTPEEESLKASAQWIYCSLQGALTAAALTEDSSWLNSAVDAVLEKHQMPKPV